MKKYKYVYGRDDGNKGSIVSKEEEQMNNSKKQFKEKLLSNKKLQRKREADAYVEGNQERHNNDNSKSLDSHKWVSKA